MKRKMNHVSFEELSLRIAIMKEIENIPDNEDSEVTGANIYHDCLSQSDRCWPTSRSASSDAFLFPFLYLYFSLVVSSMLSVASC